MQNILSDKNEFSISNWEIEGLQRDIASLQNRIDRLEKKVRKNATINFIWLVVLSNVLLWFFIIFLR